jgi:hypothetical protein
MSLAELNQVSLRVMAAALSAADPASAVKRNLVVAPAPFRRRVEPFPAAVSAAQPSR